MISVDTTHNVKDLQLYMCGVELLCTRHIRMIRYGMVGSRKLADESRERRCRENPAAICRTCARGFHLPSFYKQTKKKKKNHRSPRLIVAWTTGTGSATPAPSPRKDDRADPEKIRPGGDSSEEAGSWFQLDSHHSLTCAQQALPVLQVLS